MPFVRKSKLPRLAREAYQGRAMVFWTHTFADRATGWLSESFHQRFREVMLHASARYEVICPTYTLMPDHWHLIWMGANASSDQILATAFLRKNLAAQLAPARLQDRAHDRVLRDDQRQRESFQSISHYVRENPVRAGLVERWEEWPHTGAIVPGYADFDPRDEDFWDDFWKVYNRLVDRSE
jgi:putative transposase